MNQGLCKAGTRESSDTPDLNTERARKTVTRTVEKDNIHLYRHLIYVKRPAMHAKKEYHIRVSPAVFIGGLPKTNQYIRIRNAIDRADIAARHIADFLQLRNAQTEATTEQRTAAAGTNRYRATGITTIAMMK